MKAQQQEPANTTMSNLIPLSKVKELWTIPGKKPPSSSTIWRYRRKGLIPQPITLGRDNLYPKDAVIKKLQEYLNNQ